MQEKEIKKKAEIDETTGTTEEKQEAVTFEVEEKSTSDLEEWIEEQGIQLRY